MAIIFAAACKPALSHIGVGSVNSLAAGLAHPLFGLDHIMVMVAVGLWATLKGGRALWARPAAFVGMMLAGGALGIAGVPAPFVEPVILASIVAWTTGLLVPLHRGFDGFDWLQPGQAVGFNEQFNAAREARLPADQSRTLEGEHHLMDGRRGDAEEALHVAFGRRATVEQGVGPDEGEILALLFGEAGLGWRLAVK